ncbi:MAG: hypothetical protein Q8N08_04690 [Methanobacteriaceae archaeon]|nr:hypothetical protein [Methanobacteriaceae archaeon]
MSNDDSKIKKALQSRIKEFKFALNSEAQKKELHENIPGSEIMIRVEVFLPSSNPEEFVDGLFLYMGDSGGIVSAEYYFRDMYDVELCSLSEEELKIINELFKDDFTLEIE